MRPDQTRSHVRSSPVEVYGVEWFLESRCVSVVDAVMSPQGTVVLVVKPHSEGDVGGCFSLVLRIWRVRTSELIGTMFGAQGRLGPIAIDIITMISMDSELEPWRPAQMASKPDQTRPVLATPRPPSCVILL
jgi:hypothetical protein